MKILKVTHRRILHCRAYCDEVYLECRAVLGFLPRGCDAPAQVAEYGQGKGFRQAGAFIFPVEVALQTGKPQDGQV